MTSKAASTRLTIGLPVYNGDACIADAIESAIAQTFTDWQMIICDNASTDRTGDICRDFAARDSRIRYVRNDENIGLTRNFNKAFELSKSEYSNGSHTTTSACRRSSNDASKPSMQIPQRHGLSVGSCH